MQNLDIGDATVLGERLIYNVNAECSYRHCYLTKVT